MNARHLAVCALAGAVLAACSSNTKVATNNASPGRQTMTNPAALIAAAPGATSALKTARELTTVTSTMSGMGMFFSTNGAVDFATGQAEVTTTIGGMTEQTIVDGGTIYSSLPAGMAIPGAKPWLKITSSDLGQLGQGLGAGSALGSLLPSGNSNPANGLDILAGVSGTVTTVGTEQIGGVPTTHYRFTADLSKAMQSVPPADQASLRQMESALGAGTPTVDVWLDGSGVARQIAFAENLDLNLGALAGAAGATPPPGVPPDMSGTVISTTDFTDFGAPVTITDPPASEVMTTSQLDQLSGDGSSTP